MRLAGPLLFVAVLVLDQATKWLALRELLGRGAIEVTSFFNLVLVWNTGVSFGFMQGRGELGRWLLIGVAVVIGVALAVWLWRERRPLVQAALWLVLAGAVGNVIDRLRFGAVVDFLDFHLGGQHWPAFNVADSTIVIGAGLLLVDAFMPQRAKPADAGPDGPDRAHGPDAR